MLSVCCPLRIGRHQQSTEVGKMDSRQQQQNYERVLGRQLKKNESVFVGRCSCWQADGVEMLQDP